MAHPFLGLGFNSWTQKFSRSGSSSGGGASFKLVVGAPFDDDNGSNSGSAYIYDLDGTNETKITASDGAAKDAFGGSVAVGNNKIVVGATAYDSLNGNSSGSVYVYDLDGTNQIKITPSDGAANDAFGYSVAVGNNKIVVGAYRDDDNGDSSGSTYIYNLDGTGEIKVTASDAASSDTFGYSVAVGGNKIVVGATGDDNPSNSGSVYIYDLDGTNEVKIRASDAAANDKFGWSVAVGSNKVVVGAPYNDDPNNAGSAYIYDLDGTNETKIIASDVSSSDAFGRNVAVGGNKIAVGSPYNDDPGNSGSAYIYDLDGTNEVKIVAFDAGSNDRFGEPVAIG